MNSFHQPDPAAAPELTPREREVLELIAKGLNRADIAELLGLTKNTVADYIKTVYRKLDVSSVRPGAVFPGGRLLRGPALVAGMLYHAMRDKL